MHKDQAIFQKSRMPLYLQVAALMRQKIEDKLWRVGEQIPTLDELETEYQVSRITLRASLNQLEEQGIVRRTRGLGTFVIKDLSKERWYKLANTFGELVETVAQLKPRLLHLDRKDYPLAPAFDYGTVAQAYHRMQRVHYHNGLPYCLIEIFIEKRVYERDPQVFDHAPVVPALAAMPGLQIQGGKQLMRITTAAEDVAARLGIGIGEPVAHVFRSLVDQDGLLVYYADIQYPARTIEVEIDLFPCREAGG